MATKSASALDKLAELAAEFVEKQKGMWDHSAWTGFMGRIKKEGFDITEELQARLGELVEAMKRFYEAAGSTGSIENAMRSAVNESVAFVKRQKGVWGHAEWEEFMQTAQRNTRSLSEGATEYLGGVLESMKVFYSLSPMISSAKGASTALKEPAPTAAKPAQPPVEKAVEAAPAKPSAKPDDLTAIAGIGPAVAKKLNETGVSSYAQLAALSAAEITNLEKNVFTRAGRKKLENWVAQAKKLAGA